MDSEFITEQKKGYLSSRPPTKFEFSQLPPQVENMKEEIEKKAEDVLLILGEMGFQFQQKIPLTVIDESTYIDEFYDSTASYYKDLITGLTLQIV